MELLSKEHEEDEKMIRDVLHFKRMKLKQDVLDVVKFLYSYQYELFSFTFNFVHDDAIEEAPISCESLEEFAETMRKSNLAIIDTIDFRGIHGGTPIGGMIVPSTGAVLIRESQKKNQNIVGRQM